MYKNFDEYLSIFDCKFFLSRFTRKKNQISLVELEAPKISSFLTLFFCATKNKFLTQLYISCDSSSNLMKVMQRGFKIDDGCVEEINAHFRRG